MTYGMNAYAPLSLRTRERLRELGYHRARSLSPRPLRLTRIKSPAPRSAASLRANAIACALSSAGTMPSLRANSMERVDASRVGDVDVRRAAALLQERVLRTDAGIVEARADRVRRKHLPLVALQQIRARAVQHADAAGAERRGGLAARDAFARRPRRPTASRRGSSTKPAKIPIALLPPPTQATRRSEGVRSAPAPAGAPRCR